IHKNAGIKFPYFSNDTFDLDYFWENKAVIVSANVKNNPFESGCQVINFRGKTTDGHSVVWITQFAINYSETGNYSFGEAKWSMIRINETEVDVLQKSEWNDFLTKDDDFNFIGYLNNNEYDLNEIKEEGNYIVNSDVINNPFKEGCAMSVSRYKLNKKDETLWSVQDCVVYGSAQKRGKRAWRIIRYKSNGDFDWASDWQGDVGNKTINVLWISNSFGLNTT